MMAPPFEFLERCFLPIIMIEIAYQNVTEISSGFGQFTTVKPSQHKPDSPTAANIITLFTGQQTQFE